MRVGFVGLGDQGEYIAHRIRAAGYPLMLWARRPASLEPFLGSGATVAESLMALGSSCDLVGVCVNGEEAVEAVLFGEGAGIVNGMRPGGVVAVHSTTTPEMVIRLCKRAEGHGVAILDAPVSGARLAAIEGRLAMIVGGSAVDLEVARPVFATFTQSIVRVGDVGAGQLTKLLNNGLCFANLALALAALDIARELGLDPQATAEVISASSGKSFSFGLTQMPDTLAMMARRRSDIDLTIRQLTEALSARGIDARGIPESAALVSAALERQQTLPTTS